MKNAYRTRGSIPLPEKTDPTRPFRFVPQTSASLIEKAYHKKQQIAGNTIRRERDQILNDGLLAKLEEQVPVMNHEINEESQYVAPNYLFENNNEYQNVPMILESEKSSVVTPPPAFKTNHVYNDFESSEESQLQSLKDLLLSKKRKLQDAEALLGEAEELIIKRLIYSQKNFLKLSLTEIARRTCSIMRTSASEKSKISKIISLDFEI